MIRKNNLELCNNPSKNQSPNFVEKSTHTNFEISTPNAPPYCFSIFFEKGRNPPELRQAAKTHQSLRVGKISRIFLFWALRISAPVHQEFQVPKMEESSPI